MAQDPPLVGVRLLEDGVQGRDDRHPQVPQQAEDVAAGRAADRCRTRAGGRRRRVFKFRKSAARR